LTIREVPVRPVRLFLLATVVAVLASACGDEPSATTPTPTPPAPTPAPAAIVSVEVTPHEATLAALGDTQQFTATARRADGTVNDASAEVIWFTADPAIATVSGRGLVTGRGYGTTTVHARTGEQQWSPVRIRVPVPSGSRVRVTGVVRSQHGMPVPGADIGLLFGDVEHAGRTDGNGFFDLGTGYGALRLTVSRFGYDTARITVPDVVAQPRLQISLQENPSPYIERRLEGRLHAGSGGASHRFSTRAGATVDAIVERPVCGESSHEGGGIGLRLTSGDLVLVGEPFGACGRRVKGVVPQSECVLEVVGDSAVSYTVTVREPR
jgi:hypothetical protein